MDIWVWTLIGAVFGGAIGWALHMLVLERKAVKPSPPPVDPALVGEDAARAAALEVDLNSAREEITDLRLKSGIPAPGEEGAPLPEGSLAWRNRHLESRVRFLEGKLADVETDSSTVRITEDRNDEATRLRWRNRYLEGRVKYLEEELVRTGGLTLSRTQSVAAPVDSTLARPKGPEGEQPDLMEQPRDGVADDLKLISGIGPKLEQKLNSLGIWHYDQIAAWTQSNVDWVNAAISFRGRIERERWVPQALQMIQDGAAVTEREPENNGA
jgi:predicted flap endonuclease-1-like 5' DNA nuclease